MKSPIIPSLFAYLLIIVMNTQTHAQSLEMMPGTERFFADVQWLEALDSNRKWSVFSRVRATDDYRENTNLFMGAYLNYTTSTGFGGTVLGRISTGGSGGDIGVHYFRASKTFMIFALASLDLASDLAYSWFSIARYRPEISEKLQLYTSLELFSNFNQSGHAASVQRIRAGLESRGYQFGLALNLAGFGQDYSNTDLNPGVFIRKEF